MGKLHMSGATAIRYFEQRGVSAYVDINNVINQSSDPKLIFNSKYEFMRIKVLEFNFVSNNYANDPYELSVHQGNFLYMIQ